MSSADGEAGAGARRHPRPARAPAVAMRWTDLLFAHWAYPPGAVRPHIPPELEIDTFAGDAWVGVVPFFMTLRPRRAPWPALRFAELNVRTYVVHGGRPGVWFFSLDAGSRLAVRGARRWFHLPYFDARMACHRVADAVDYDSRRIHEGAAPAVLDARYRPTGDPLELEVGGLVEWLTARYRLFAYDGRRVHRGEIDHLPWALQPAEAELATQTVTAAAGLGTPKTRPLLHFARSIDVVSWSLEPA